MFCFVFKNSREGRVWSSVKSFLWFHSSCLFLCLYFKRTERAAAELYITHDELEASLLEKTIYTITKSATSGKFCYMKWKKITHIPDFFCSVKAC